MPFRQEGIVRKVAHREGLEPQHAVLESAALPVALPVQSEGRMLPASDSRETHQPLMHITCFKVCTTSTSSACAAMTASMLL
jgi:hypothetical protein